MFNLVSVGCNTLLTESEALVRWLQNKADDKTVCEFILFHRAKIALLVLVNLSFIAH